MDQNTLTTPPNQYNYGQWLPSQALPQPAPQSQPSELGSDISQGGKVINTIMSGMRPAGSALSSLPMANGLGGLATPGMSGLPSVGVSGLGSAGSILGKAVPIAGIGTGVLGMIKNKSAIGNLLSGATAGASLGSIVPGLGTLVGGGLGALAGGVEDLFRIGKPSAQELEGRSSQAGVTNNISGYATPQQQSEAQDAVKSGSWDDPKQALNLIVTRDALIKNGLSPADAVAQSNKMIGNLNSAEGSGAAGVSQAASPIQQLLQYHK